MESMGSPTSEALTRLQSLDKVCVRQKTNTQMFSFSGNKFSVTDPEGQVLFQAQERGGSKMWGGKSRAFDIDILDAQERQVMTLRRPHTFGPDKMDVSVYGQLVSVVRQERTFLKPILDINDAADHTIFRVKGPVATSMECDYVIFNLNKQQIGVIRKTFGGWKRELLTDSDNFTIEFPMDLDVNFKAAIIATCLLIDYLYFEK